MTTSLNHLTQEERIRVEEIAGVIRSVVDPDMIVFFGHYDGKPGADNNIIDNVGGKDYNFLVVMGATQVSNADQIHAIEVGMKRRGASANLELHNADFINRGLEAGQEFFISILKNGLVVYDNGKTTLSEAKHLTNEEKKDVVVRNFRNWNQGSAFLKAAILNAGEQDTDVAAFHLHQATEHFYAAVLLVFTGFKPKTHNLATLRKKAKWLSEELYGVFAVEEDAGERKLFDQLRRSYIEARYSSRYEISQDELLSLLEKVKKIEEISRRLCQKRLESFE